MKSVIAVLLLATTGAVAQTPPSPSVSLAWQETDSGDTFNVYRGNGPCSSNPTFTKVATAIATTSYLDTTVAISTFYSYQVTAVSAAGKESAPSNCFPVSVPPNVPQNLTGKTN